MMVSPGFSSPLASASSTMAIASRSFTDPPGLNDSALVNSVTLGGAIRCRRTTGVWPMVSRMLSWIVMVGSCGKRRVVNAKDPSPRPRRPQMVDARRRHLQSRIHSRETAGCPCGPGMPLPTSFLLYAGIGFAAQLIDGALGMAYGVVTASLLLAFGLPPPLVSASVHAAEVAITGVSGVSHSVFGNIDRRLMWALAVPGVIGGAVGALLLSWIHWDWLRPLVALYLLGLGVLLLSRAWGRKRGASTRHALVPLGLVAGFLDAVTGGGWGSLTTSTLVAQHHEPRFAIGTA